MIKTFLVQVTRLASKSKKSIHLKYNFFRAFEIKHNDKGIKLKHCYRCESVF